MTGLVSPLLQPLVAGLLDARKSAAEPLPVIDYLLWIGSSTPYETSQVNTVLGRQEQTLIQAPTPTEADYIKNRVRGLVRGFGRAGVDTSGW